MAGPDAAVVDEEVEEDPVPEVPVVEGLGDVSPAGSPPDDGGVVPPAGNPPGVGAGLGDGVGDGEGEGEVPPPARQTVICWLASTWLSWPEGWLW